MCPTSPATSILYVQQALLCLKNRLSRSLYAPLVNIFLLLDTQLRLLSFLITVSASDNQRGTITYKPLPLPAFCLSNEMLQRGTAGSIWNCIVHIAATSHLFALLLTSNYA